MHFHFLPWLYRGDMNSRRLDQHHAGHHSEMLLSSTSSSYGATSGGCDAGSTGETMPLSLSSSLHNQPSTDQQTDSEQSQPTTVTSHLSLPHFALHRQVSCILDKGSDAMQRGLPVSFFLLPAHVVVLIIKYTSRSTRRLIYIHDRKSYNIIHLRKMGLSLRTTSQLFNTGPFKQFHNAKKR